MRFSQFSQCYLDTVLRKCTHEWMMKNEETINMTVLTIKCLVQVHRLNNNKLTKKTDREGTRRK